MYNTIIHSLCKNKLLGDACDVYSEMIVKGISPDVVTYTTLIHGFCIMGHLKGIRDHLQGISGGTHKSGIRITSLVSH